MASDKIDTEQSSRRRVLETLRINGPLARVELAEAINISPAAVTAATAELIAEGFLEEAPDAQEAGASKRGRPRVRLQLRADAAYVAGVRVSMHEISVSVTNFTGDLLGTRVVAVRVNRQSPEIIAQMIEDALRQATEALKLSMAQIEGVGVALPGFIDCEAGEINWSPIFGDRQIPFARLMSEKLRRPVFIDNNANLATLAQQWFGRCKGVANFLLITIDHGVGMGVVMGGKLHRGARGFGAEFGHMKIQRSGALCRCGQRGCIEAYLADYAILREASTFRPFPDNTDPFLAKGSLQDLIAQGEAGDVRVRSIYKRAGEILGVGLANLINIFGPERIVITGAGVAARSLFEPEMRRALEVNTLSGSEGTTPVEIIGPTDAAWAHGAAALVLERQGWGWNGVRHEAKEA